ncbi:hypothetical protein P2H44_10605 [Albimonas sp. CAU 1670]|uniref:hypothetical protein n=1 Tax=Albimonas sp. CAU 1670 TaxID=3032599 RepID=UPI0023DCDF11|nr:hypothetical protein [Albimonas sp. CAU 1670]MDF2233004.1 hypothetical protein [Albimonas sp. CAU 1670]
MMAPIARFVRRSRLPKPADLARFVPRAETALWAPAALVAGFALTDYVLVLRAEAELRVAASQAALSLGAGEIAPREAARRVRARLQGEARHAVSVSVSMSDRVAVEARIPTGAATLFGFHWFLPGDVIGARAEAPMLEGGAEVELVQGDRPAN